MIQRPQPTTRYTSMPAPRPLLDQLSRGLLWAMVASLTLGGLVGAALLLGGAGDATTWRIDSTLFGLALHCGIALVFTRGARGSRLSIPATICIALTTLNLTILLAATWVINEHGEAWAQTGVLILAAILLTPARTLFRKRLHPWAVWLGVLTSGATAALTIVDIWLPWQWQQTWPIDDEAVGTAWVIAAAVAFATALYAWRAHPRLRWLRIIVTILIGASAAMITIIIWNMSTHTDEFFGRLTMVVTLLAVCGIGVHATLSFLLRPAAVTTGPRTAIDLELRCPKCREDLTLPTGSSACPHCKTKFEIRVLPTSCLKCGYDLASLRQPTCPECGSVY